MPKDIIRKDADSKEGLIACLYEWSDVAKAEGTQGQETPVSKHIREGGFDDNPIDPTVSTPTFSDCTKLRLREAVSRRP